VSAGVASDLVSDVAPPHSGVRDRDEHPEVVVAEQGSTLGDERRLPVLWLRSECPSSPGVLP
jgi:hypothetical protein